MEGGAGSNVWMKKLILSLCVSLAVVGVVQECGAESGVAAFAEDKPVYAVYDTKNHEMLGLIRHDARGLALLELKCGDPRFQDFALEVIKGLEEPAGNKGEKVPDVKRTDNVTTSHPLSLADYATTEIDEFRKFVEERGPAAGLRGFARTKISRDLRAMPDDPLVYRVDAEGSYLGLRGPNGMLMHPQAMAREIKSDPEFPKVKRVQLLAPGVGRSTFPNKLAELVGLPVVATDEIIDFKGLSIVDVYLLSDREITGFSKDAENGDAKAAYVLYRYYDAQAMIQPKDIAKLSAKAYDFLIKAAEGGSVVAQNDAAMINLTQKKPNKEEALRWIKKLDANPQLKDDELLQQNIGVMRKEAN